MIPGTGLAIRRLNRTYQYLLAYNLPQFQIRAGFLSRTEDGILPVHHFFTLLLKYIPLRLRKLLLLLSPFAFTNLYSQIRI